MGLGADFDIEPRSTPGISSEVTTESRPTLSNQTLAGGRDGLGTNQHRKQQSKLTTLNRATSNISI